MRFDRERGCRRFGFEQFRLLSAFSALLNIDDNQAIQMNFFSKIIPYSFDDQGRMQPPWPALFQQMLAEYKSRAVSGHTQNTSLPKHETRNTKPPNIKDSVKADEEGKSTFTLYILKLTLFQFPISFNHDVPRLPHHFQAAVLPSGDKQDLNLPTPIATRPTRLKCRTKARDDVRQSFQRGVLVAIQIRYTSLLCLFPARSRQVSSCRQEL